MDNDFNFDNDSDTLSRRSTSRKKRTRRHSSAPPLSRTVYIILALFLGSLGIHNFYAGRAAEGTFQVVWFFASLLLCVVGIGFLMLVLLLIWQLVNIVCTQTDGEGCWMQ